MIKDWERDGTFSAHEGDEVEPAIYKQMLNGVPPKRPYPEVLERGENIIEGFLMGEAYSTDEDGYNLYLTFGRDSEGGCYYLGLSKAHREDSKHEIVRDCELPNRGELHRFMNPVGVLYSAIYQDGYEVFSCERPREEDMVRYWCEMA